MATDAANGRPARQYIGNADIERPYTDGTRQTAYYQLEKAKAAVAEVDAMITAVIIRDSNNWYIPDQEYDLLGFTVTQLLDILAQP